MEIFKNMKQHLENLLRFSLKQLQESGELPTIPALIAIEPTKDSRHGDYASNIAFLLAKSAKKKPREIAERIISLLPLSPYVEKVEIAGPGFLNFFLTHQALYDVVAKILLEKAAYGSSKMGRDKQVILEFVSSNPTGPLHVGHGRHAAYGDVVANLLRVVGFQTYSEYYVNDAGRQMDILTISIWLRYLTICGEEITFPENAYRGDYVISIAKAIHEQHGLHFCIPAQKIYQNLSAMKLVENDQEAYIDALIAQTKVLLGDKYLAIYDLGLGNILADIREDLAEFGVHFNNWCSERQFVNTRMVDLLIEKLKKANSVYEQDGAIWFRSSLFGDEKDRVLVRSNGQFTYFANDIAYHLNKFERGFDIAIDIVGSDHHGYVSRMKAAMQALGINPERLLYLLVQFVTLYRGNEQVQMSTRGGNFVTLRELREEVGNDAARFFYVMRKYEQHMDFDLNLAKSQSNENPVYYVQYAYARICSVYKQLAERNLHFDEANGIAHLDLLTREQERQLLNTLSHYPDIIVDAALHYEPHQLTNYLRDLAANFHTYYNSHQFLVEEKDLRDARLALISATQQTLLNGFKLLGISAPESM